MNKATARALQRRSKAGDRLTSVQWADLAKYHAADEAVRFSRLAIWLAVVAAALALVSFALKVAS